MSVHDDEHDVWGDRSNAEYHDAGTIGRFIPAAMGSFDWMLCASLVVPLPAQRANGQMPLLICVGSTLNIFAFHWLMLASGWHLEQRGATGIQRYLPIAVNCAPLCSYRSYASNGFTTDTPAFR